MDRQRRYQPAVAVRTRLTTGKGECQVRSPAPDCRLSRRLGGTVCAPESATIRSTYRSGQTTLPVTACSAAGGGPHLRVTGQGRRRRRPRRPAVPDPSSTSRSPPAHHPVRETARAALTRAAWVPRAGRGPGRCGRCRPPPYLGHPAADRRTGDGLPAGLPAGTDCTGRRQTQTRQTDEQSEYAAPLVRLVETLDRQERAQPCDQNPDGECHRPPTQPTTMRHHAMMDRCGTGGITAPTIAALMTGTARLPKSVDPSPLCGPTPVCTARSGSIWVVASDLGGSPVDDCRFLPGVG